MPSRFPLAIAVSLGLVLTLSACASPAEPTETPTPTASAEEPEGTPEPAASEAPPEESEAPTCETIVSQGTIDGLTEAGWTVEEEEFRIGSEPIDGGIQCFWADYTVASDHGQLYAWAPMDDDEATEAQELLLSQGWLRESGPDGIYLTEDPAFALDLDEDGYGMTYLFGDGWVILADTRQGLILINRP